MHNHIGCILIFSAVFLSILLLLFSPYVSADHVPPPSMFPLGPDSGVGGPVSNTRVGSQTLPNATAVANSQVAVSITRGACLPPNAVAGPNAGRQGVVNQHLSQQQPGVVTIPVQHNRAQASQGVSSIGKVLGSGTWSNGKSDQCKLDDQICFG